jgi:propanol-preferring alcohol dehydrogenase
MIEKAGVRTVTERFPLEHANQALQRLRDGQLTGAAVICPDAQA